MAPISGAFPFEKVRCNCLLSLSSFATDDLPDPLGNRHKVKNEREFRPFLPKGVIPYAQASVTNASQGLTCSLNRRNMLQVSDNDVNHVIVWQIQHTSMVHIFVLLRCSRGRARGMHDGGVKGSTTTASLALRCSQAVQGTEAATAVQNVLCKGARVLDRALRRLQECCCPCTLLAFHDSWLKCTARRKYCVESQKRHGCCSLQM